jgi:hypothetical protein
MTSDSFVSSGVTVIAWTFVPSPRVASVPPLVRRCRREVSVEEIGGGRLARGRYWSCTEPLTHARLQLLFLHQPDHALAAHSLAVLEQIAVNARAPIPLFTALGRRAHGHLQLPVRFARTDSGRSCHA